LTTIRIIFLFYYNKVQNHIFNMHLNRFQKNESTCLDVWVLQNWLQVDEIRSIIEFSLLSSQWKLKIYLCAFKLYIL